MNSIFLDASERDEIQRKAAETDWAPALVNRLRESIERDPAKPETAYETIQPYARARARSRQARDRALIYVATGDNAPLEGMVELFRQNFRLDAMDSPLDETPPPEISRLNAKQVKNWRPGHWSYGLMSGSFFYAYDLTRDHSIWQQNGQGERVEQRFQEVLDATKWRQAQQRGWGNTNTWYAATVAVLGALLGDDEAVDLAIDGPLGFKAMLGILHDGGFWPEPVMYGCNYVKCVLTIIAEVARHTGRENLYNWQTDEGVSLKSMYDRFLEFAFAHGRLAGHGDSGGTSEYANVRAAERFTTWNHPVSRLWHHTHTRNCNTYEIAYRAYKDPRYAWLLSQTPGRETWDHEFFGYTALTHGVPLGETQPPDATSKLWRQYGGALLRGDETADYWNGPAPAVYIRNGQPQAHGHSDGGNILLNAFDRNLYPDYQYKWNYGGRIDPDTGKNLNPTPYGKMRFAHNTVSVDCGENNSHFAQFEAIRRSGPMKVIVLYDNAHQIRRTIGVTPEYVFDWTCAGLISEPTVENEHTFDYHLRSVGLPELTGVDALEPYTTLGEEYGLGPIDTRSEAPGNQWIRPGVSGTTDEDWQAVMTEERPLDPAEPRGVRLHVLGTPGTRVITGDTPDYVSMEGWDASQPEEGTPSRLGLLVIRRHAVNTEFVVIHQPFCGDTPHPLGVHRTGNTLEVAGGGFRDRIELPYVRCRREVQ